MNNLSKKQKIRATLILGLIFLFILLFFISSPSTKLVKIFAAWHQDSNGKIVITQKSNNDCGIACIAMVLTEFDIPFKYNDLINSETHKDGISLLDIQKIIVNKKLTAECFHVNIEYLKSFHGTAILPIYPNHYQVLDGYTHGQGFRVRDPEQGIGAIFIPDWEAKIIFKGIALEITQTHGVNDAKHNRKK